jgi:hypothetical protein
MIRPEQLRQAAILSMVILNIDNKITASNS